MLRTQSIIVVEGADGTSWEAMSVEDEHPTWYRLTIPPEIRASPIMGTDTVALGLKGKAIDHVAAFSKYYAEWSKQHLLKPVEGELTPIIGPGCALYQAGNDFYAFSAMKGKWGVLHLEGDPKAQAVLSPNDVQVQQGNKLYVFSVKGGEWSKGVAVKVRPSRKSAPVTPPARGRPRAKEAARVAD
jgi:hypothetical protein